MVKVLENKLVDLDVLPGQEQIDLQKRFREQMQQAKGAAGQLEGGQGKEVELPEGARVVEGQEGAKIAQQQGFQIPKDMLPADLSEEQKSKARGFGGVIVDGSGKVISGLAGTVGGVLKGVGDTAGNAVYGLANTGTGLVTGLADTARAPFAGGGATAAPATESTAQPPPSNVVDAPASEEEVAAEKRKPRKIELRSGGGQPAAEPGAAGQTVED